jgi:hypothetical protein
VNGRCRRSMEEHGRRRKSLEVRGRQRYCESGRVSRTLLSTMPESPLLPGRPLERSCSAAGALLRWEIHRGTFFFSAATNEAGALSPLAITLPRPP